ncbi:MAG: hypothetical protein ABFE07_06515 [Armatimonadia bacterium]
MAKIEIDLDAVAAERIAACEKKIRGLEATLKAKDRAYAKLLESVKTNRENRSAVLAAAENLVKELRDREWVEDWSE